MATASETGEGVDETTATSEGVYLVGSFLGVRRPADYEIDGRKGTSAPKFGIEVDGVEYAVAAKDERALYDLSQGWAKGDRVYVRVYPTAGRYGLRWSTTPAGGTWE